MADVLSSRMGALTLDKKPTKVWVDSTTGVAAALHDMRNESMFAFDCEGVNLGRHGKLTVLQLASFTSAAVWLFDISTLKCGAFTTQSSGPEGLTLKSVLENERIKKAATSLNEMSLFPGSGLTRVMQHMVIYDVRQDSDALFNQYEVSLKGIHDLQLAEVLARRGLGHRVRFVRGFGTALSEYCPNADAEVGKLKVRVNAQFEADPEVWDRRPLPEDLVTYAANDVRFLIEIYKKLATRLIPTETDRVSVASIVRVNECRRHPTPTQGRHRAIVPAL